MSDVLNASDTRALTCCHPLFAHLTKMMEKVNLSLVFDLFGDDPNCASQSAIPAQRRLQFLFLALIHKLHMPSLVRSLTGNYTASFRDRESILNRCRPILPPDVFAHLERVLNHKNPASFYGHTSAS